MLHIKFNARDPYFMQLYGGQAHQDDRSGRSGTIAVSDFGNPVGNSGTWRVMNAVQHIQSQPREFAPLIELDPFVDVHSVPAGPEPGLDAPHQP